MVSFLSFAAVSYMSAALSGRESEAAGDAWRGGVSLCPCAGMRLEALRGAPDESAAIPPGMAICGDAEAWESM